MSVAAPNSLSAPDYLAAHTGLAHRVRSVGILDVEGEGRAAFLQGQLTQDVASLSAGRTRPTAALTAKGKPVFLATVIGLPGRIRPLLPSASPLPGLGPLRKSL